MIFDGEPSTAIPFTFLRVWPLNSAELGYLMCVEDYELVLRWVTVSAFNSRYGTFISVCGQPPRSTQPGIPSWVGAMSTSQRALMPCGWGVKAGMVRVWVAGKTVW